MEVKGVDISKWQGSVNMSELDKDVDFVIIKSSFGKEMNQIDPKFMEFYNLAEQQGISKGAYHYGYAISVEEALQEADVFLNTVKGLRFDYPVYYDVEDANTMGTLSKDLLTDVVFAFLEKVESAGYHVGLYANYNWVTTKLNMDKLQRFDLWIARYNDTLGYTGNDGAEVWQYSSKGTGSEYGVSSTNIDLDVSYRDYPSIIKAEGRNGYGTVQVVPAQSIVVQPSRTYTHCIGEHIVFSTYYNSSTDTVDKAHGSDELNRNHGVITRIVDAVNPYLLDDGLCWVNDGDIRGFYDASVPVPDPQPVITVGSKVRVVNAVQYNGKPFKVYYDEYDVIQVNGDKVVIGIGNTATASVNINDITLA